MTKATTEKKKPEKSLGKNSFKNFRAHAAPQKLSPWLSYAKALGPWRPKQLTFAVAVAVAVFTEMVGAALPPSLAPSTRTFSHSASLPSLKQRHSSTTSSSAATRAAPSPQTALFDFSSLCVVLLLLICSAAFVQARTETRNEDGTLSTWFMVRNVQKPGFMGIAWKFARVGERLSPYISVLCVLAAAHLILLK